jgi:RNA polymerase sigma-70 factor (ECF subfamily)
MSFPNTRKTLLGRLKKEGDESLWQSSWVEFFDIYHLSVRVCVIQSFARRGWQTISESDIDEVTMLVFHSWIQAIKTFELEDAKGKLRQFLTTLCQRRVVDFMRSQRRHNEGRVQIDLVDPSSPPEETEESQELMNAYQISLQALLFSELREQVSPRIYLIFESVKIKNRKPIDVARELGVTRGVVDNSIHKAMNKLVALKNKLNLADIG